MRLKASKKMATMASLKRWWVFKTRAHKKFNKAEFDQIKELFRASRRGTFVNRVVTKEAFVNFFSDNDLAKPLPPSLARALFRALVREGETALTYNDLVHGFGICAHGSEREQLELLFRMYSTDSGAEEDYSPPVLDSSLLCARQLANMLADADLAANPDDTRMARRFFNEEMKTAFRGRDVLTSHEFAQWVQRYSRGVRVVFDAICDVAFPGRDVVQAQFSGEVYDGHEPVFQVEDDELSDYEL